MALLAVIYLAFISLGLPDSLLGSGWPVMQHDLSVPSSYAGYVFMAISFMTILSALLSPMLIKRVHTKWIVAGSIFLTIIGLMGFSISSRYWMLFIFAVPYGAGAGSIDASLNHYVANNYSSSAMNFLHCFYGAGAIISPIIMAMALKYAHWNEGYRWTAYVQAGILAVCLLTMSLWKKSREQNEEANRDSASIAQAIIVPGVIPTLIAFFAYCSGEATCFLWTSSYFAGTKTGMSDGLIAAFGSLVFGGLMIGRFVAGLISNKLDDRVLIRAGLAVEAAGVLLILVPFPGYIPAAAGFLITGIGMGPVYPAIQHMAPINFGRKNSAAVIAMQMASAYIGSTFMPMVFGHLQQAAGIYIMPFYVALFALLNFVMLELAYKMIKK